MTTETLVQDVALKTYTIDPAHTQVGFSVRHLGFSKVRGRFESFSGTLHLEENRLQEVTATIEATSINTGEERRDAHLRSGDFFAAETYPTLTFKSTGTADLSSPSPSLAGALTIRGVTKPVELELTYLGEAEDPWGGSRIAFEARTKVNRKDFGLNWNAVLETGGVLVGEEVEITLEVQAVRND